MQWISKALCRFGCASMASVLCLVPYLGYLLLRMEVASAVLFFVFGLYMAFKGIISLTAVSFILDERLLNHSVFIGAGLMTSLIYVLMLQKALANRL